MVKAPPPAGKLEYSLSVLKHLILPVGAVFISTIFASIFSQRTFFLIYSSEDYVDMAKAKGLSDRAIERRYILRPTLPAIITNVALSFITLWSGNVTLEQVFNWPGLGLLFWQASLARGYAHHRGQHHHLRVPAGRHRALVGHRVRNRGPPGESRSGGAVIVNRFLSGLRQLSQYPSAIAGLVLIFLFIGLAVYAMASMPLSQAIDLWRGSGDTWQYTPRNAAPAWLNVFPGINRPVTMDFDTRALPESRTVEEIAPGMWEVKVSFPFEFTYDDFPTEINVFTEVRNSSSRPFFSMTWFTPDGREIPLGDADLRSAESFRLGQDSRLTRRLGGRAANVGLFADPGADGTAPLKGRYELVAEALMFEPDAEINVRLVVYGQLHGWAGTDHRRRDLTVALLWGTPIALAMGLMGAVGATVTTMAIAAIGTWYGGWVDTLIQRITEVNLMIPALPLLIMIGTLVNRSLLLLTLIWVALSIFSASIKSYRAMFLQVKEAPYIEAARSSAPATCASSSAI